MTIPTAVQEAYARAQIDVTELTCVELRHNGSPTVLPGGVLRLVGHTSDVTVTHEATAPARPSLPCVYVGIGMEASRPVIDVEASKAEQVIMDGVSGYLQPYLNNLNQSTTRVEVSVRNIALNVTSGDVMGITQVRHLNLDQDIVTATAVSLELTNVNPANKPFPNQLYGPDEYPGLYE